MPLIYPTSFLGFVERTNGGMKDLFTAVNAKVATTIVQARAILLEGATGSQIIIDPDATVSDAAGTVPSILLKPALSNDYASIIHRGVPGDDALAFRPAQESGNGRLSIDPEKVEVTNSSGSSMRLDEDGFEARMLNGYGMWMGKNEFYIQRQAGNDQLSGIVLHVNGKNVQIYNRNPQGYYHGGMIEVTPSTITFKREPYDSYRGGKILITNNEVRMGYATGIASWSCYFRLSSSGFNHVGSLGWI